MKRLCIAVVMLLNGCTSIQSGVLSDQQFTAQGGKPLGIIQVNRYTVTILLDLVDFVKADFDEANKILGNEAKGFGENHKVQIVSTRTSPRGGVWALLCAVACLNSTEVVGVVVEPASAPAPVVPADAPVP